MSHKPAVVKTTENMYFFGSISAIHSGFLVQFHQCWPTPSQGISPLDLPTTQLEGDPQSNLGLLRKDGRGKVVKSSGWWLNQPNQLKNMRKSNWIISPSMG